MIVSWSKQTIIKPLYVSLSHTFKKSPKLIDDFIEKWNTVNFTVRDTRHSQFEHYNLLLEENKDTFKNEWIMFTDDDDLWNTCRIETYMDFLSTIDIRYINAECFTIKGTIVGDDSCVCLVDDINLQKCNDVITDEYIDICIKYEKLVETINKVLKEEVKLSNPLFDIHMKVSLTYQLFGGYKSENWLYFYRKYISDGPKWNSPENLLEKPLR